MLDMFGPLLDDSLYFVVSYASAEAQDQGGVSRLAQQE